METDPLRVLIVADDPLARAGLATLLAASSGCTVVGQLPGHIDLPPEIDIFQPEVALIDFGWNPGLVLTQLEPLFDSPLPIVALLPDETQATDLWEAGLRSLLFRDSAVDKLVAALKATAHGLAVIEPGLLTTLGCDDRSPALELPSESLTPREVEVLQLLAEGLSNKAIAHRLSISDHTVKFHVNGIMSKLGAQSRTEAVVRATRSGLLLL